MLYKFNISFLLHYKIMSNSSLSSSSTVQHTNNNSFTYAYEHFEFIFVAFATLVITYFDKIITIDLPKSQFCEKCAFYTNFVNCSDNFCLLRWHNRLKPIFYTTNFNNSLCKHTVTYNGKFSN